jgi:hypothetical protein
VDSGLNLVYVRIFSLYNSDIATHTGLKIKVKISRADS